MYQAKTNGGGHYEVLDPNARIAVDRRRDLERDLQQAQQRGQLSLAYQPIVDVRSRVLVGVEGLVRWQHPQRRLVGSAVIIPSAERTGLILPLAEWVRLGAAAMGAAFVEMVDRVLRETGADPQTLWLEITETVFLADGPRALQVMNDLKALGVKLALDDFGTGYSSLGCLRDFPFDIVKIDRNFTAQLSTDRATRFIVEAMIDLSHALGLAVVAEGVETAPELAQISEIGADHVQGFLLSHPLTADQLTALLAAGAGWH